jgi:hypothetical protein
MYNTLGRTHSLVALVLAWVVVTLCLGATTSAQTSKPAQQVQAVAAPPACSGTGECLCDSSYQDCRTPIIQLIRNEHVGIDVSFWFMTDQRYSQELINKWKNEHVPIRVILDTRADKAYPATANIRSQLAAAGIPIRNYHGVAINHWKMMLFAGQGKVEFSAANYADGSYSPSPLNLAYAQYVDEAIYFTDDLGIVQSFMKRYDTNWVDTTTFANYANITGPLVRAYPTTYSIVPELNFVPDQKYDSRLINLIRLETQQIDAVMFRITASNIPDELIARWQAGVPVRVITEEEQYRTPVYLWDSYNVDRMYAAGIPIKVKDNVTQQDVHQKSIVLYSRGKAVFGSSNWTTLAQTTEMDHNYFATNAGTRAKPWILDWFKAQFERKWNNKKEDGTPILNADGTPRAIYIDFVPLPPETPVYVSPANDALGQPSAVTLKWEGGYWAHKYDVYLDTTPTFTSPIIVDYMPGEATAGVVSAKESWTVSGLLPATTYYWKIVSKTMANKPSLNKTGPTWHFTTAGGVPPPPAPSGLTATSVSQSQITLQWNDVAGEEGYKVERKLASDPTTAWTQIRTTAADVVTYTDTASGLKANTAYNYRVRAFTTGGNSDYSNVLNVSTPAGSLSQRDVVLYASKAPVLVGAGQWGTPADATAAGGKRLASLNPGGGTLAVSAAPAAYVEIPFNASANVPYRLWIRGKALNDSGFADSMFVQFSDSVTQGGANTFRIGTTSAAMVNIEDCKGCGLKAWGWQDNGFGVGVMGPLIYFHDSGSHVMRIQPRERGFSVDQIVLSPDTYLNGSPGVLKNDGLIFPEQNNPVGPPDETLPTVSITDPVDGETVQGVVPVKVTATDNVRVDRVELWVDGALKQTDNVSPFAFDWDARSTPDGDHTLEARAFDPSGNSARSGVLTVTVFNPATLSNDVVLYAAEAPVRVGSWAVVTDATAAGGKRIHQPNAGLAKISTPSPTPAHYFEMTFNAEAGIAYRLWLRGKADNNDWANDSVFAQFSGSTTQAGAATFRIGTTSGTAINLEDCSGCGVSGWGWQDNGWGVNVFGPLIYFASSGPQTIRIQAREDGFSIDQIVLSPANYIDNAPGALKNDNTILPKP